MIFFKKGVNTGRLSLEWTCRDAQLERVKIGGSMGPLGSFINAQGQWSSCRHAKNLASVTNLKCDGFDS